jgi:hypothetical protein
MKQDANSIVRDHGVAHLRRVFDQAPMFNPRDTVDSIDAFGVSPQEAPTVTAPRFAPIAIDDVTIAAEPAWLIDGLLPARGLACIVGPPKSGKSFLTSDMLCAVARGASYAGRETLPGPVIYLTGEGVSGFKRRLVAMRRHLGIEGQGVPFFMIENVPDLGSEATDLPQLLAELDAFVAQVFPEGRLRSPWTRWRAAWARLTRTAPGIWAAS